MTEEALFQLALNTPAAERPALLDHECAGKNACKGKGGCAIPVKHEPKK